MTLVELRLYKGRFGGGCTAVALSKQAVPIKTMKMKNKKYEFMQTNNR